MCLCRNDDCSEIGDNLLGSVIDRLLHSRSRTDGDCNKRRGLAKTLQSAEFRWILHRPTAIVRVFGKCVCFFNANCQGRNNYSDWIKPVTLHNSYGQRDWVSTEQNDCHNLYAFPKNWIIIYLFNLNKQPSRFLDKLFSFVLLEQLVCQYDKI